MSLKNSLKNVETLKSFITDYEFDYLIAKFSDQVIIGFDLMRFGREGISEFRRQKYIKNEIVAYIGFDRFNDDGDGPCLIYEDDYLLYAYRIRDCRMICYDDKSDRINVDIEKVREELAQLVGSLKKSS